jgi:hypothetical protein
MLINEAEIMNREHLIQLWAIAELMNKSFNETEIMNRGHLCNSPCPNERVAS